MKKRKLPRPYGFESLSPVELQLVSQKGGQNAQKKVYRMPHKFREADGRKAGKVGGKKLAKDRMHMSKIGKAGGQKKASNRLQNLVDSYFNNTEENF